MGWRWSGKTAPVAGKVIAAVLPPVKKGESLHNNKIVPKRDFDYVAVEK